MNLREAMQDVYNQSGKLTPRLVVETARKQRSDAGKFLHGHFEWNDAVAAEAHRCSQAQNLIRTVRVRYRKAGDDEILSVRAFYAVHTEKGHVYEPYERVVNDPLLREIVLANFKRDWEEFKDRWEHLDEFVELISQDAVELVGA